MNRRGFLSSLVGVVGWAKSGLRVSPAASAIQPTYEKPIPYFHDLMPSVQPMPLGMQVLGDPENVSKISELSIARRAGRVRV